MTPSANQTFILHPSPDHILKLWQIFLTNVNPMTKIIHQPSLQLSIEKSIPDLEHMPRGLEALLFAIYGASVHSMRDGECQATFGEPRSTLQARYRLGVRRSLTKAQFMRTSDLMVLQAFVIYLVSERPVYKCSSLIMHSLLCVKTWILAPCGLYQALLIV
jgi:hypothetical protein